MSSAVNVGVRQRRGLRAEGFAVAKNHRQLDSDAPTISSGSGAPTHSAPDASVYLRDDGSSGAIFYIMIAGTWTAIAATAVSGTDFGAGGIATDVIAESTAAAGVTIDGLLIKDERIQVTGAGIATGDAGVTLKDNLASAWDFKEGSNVYLRLVTTDSSEAVQSHQRLTTTDGVASGTARIVGGLAYVNTAASDPITGATETETLFSTQYSLPANSLKAGTVVRVRAQGIHTATTGSENHSMILKIGSVAVTTMATVDPANNDIWYFDAVIICRTAGASGTIVASGTQLAQAQTGVGTAKPFFLASTTIDTTGANIIGVAIDRQASATDSDSARLDVLTVEVIG